MTSPRYPSDGRLGAERGLVEIDLDKAMENERCDARDGLRFLECLEAFSERQGAVFVERRQQADPVPERCFMGGITQQVTRVAQPEAIVDFGTIEQFVVSADTPVLRRNDCDIYGNNTIGGVQITGATVLVENLEIGNMGDPVSAERGGHASPSGDRRVHIENAADIACRLRAEQAYAIALYGARRVIASDRRGVSGGAQHRGLLGNSHGILGQKGLDVTAVIAMAGVNLFV